MVEKRNFLHYVLLSITLINIGLVIYWKESHINTINNLFTNNPTLNPYDRIKCDPNVCIDHPFEYKIKDNRCNVKEAKFEQFKEKLNKFMDESSISLQMMRNNQSTPNDGRNFVTCVGTNGMGNVLQIVVSCLLLAYTSNRFPIINHKSNHFVDYRSWPFNDPYNVLIGEGESNPPGIFHMHYQFCGDLTKIEPETKNLISYGSGGYDYFGSFLLANPDTGLKKVLPLNWFQMMMDKVMPINSHHRNKTDEFKAKYFKKYNIAIQIRAVVAGDHIDAPPLAPVEIFFHAAETLSREVESKRGISYQDIGWFIATQDEGIIQWFKYQRSKICPNATVSNVAGPAVPSFGGDKENAITTFILMSESDDMIASDFSSYGQTAAARGGVVPVVCNHHKFCGRRMVPQPAQQTPYPPRLAHASGMGCYHRMTTTESVVEPFFAPDMSSSYFAGLWREDEMVRMKQNNLTQFELLYQKH